MNQRRNNQMKWYKDQSSARFAGSSASTCDCGFFTWIDILRYLIVWFEFNIHNISLSTGYLRVSFYGLCLQADWVRFKETLTSWNLSCLSLRLMSRNYVRVPPTCPRNRLKSSLPLFPPHSRCGKWNRCVKSYQETSYILVSLILRKAKD